MKTLESMRKPLQDALTCIRHGCTIDQAGLHLMPNAERCLKPPEQIVHLFTDDPQAIARTIDIAQQTSGFNLDQLRYDYVPIPKPAAHEVLVKVKACALNHLQQNLFALLRRSS